MLDPMAVEGHSIPVTTSIGIATYPTDTRDLELLIRCADAAMYDAKASGRRASRRYTVNLHARALEKSGMEEGLRLALARDEFVLHYQPKIGIDSGSCTSVEALIRWDRPGHGIVGPAVFISSLEETGLIVPVGTWVIGRACRQMREWERSGFGRLRIAVNVSSKQVRENRFVSQVAEALREHRVAPQQLEMEITESMLMANDEITGAALREIKALGISIAIDDFGTGYSNLAYLKRFPIDALKIDIAFIRDVTTNPDAAAIAIAIINMAHSLRLRVIAEGVETPEQMEFLSLHGCDDVQGYLLSKPLPADEFETYLRLNIAKSSKQQVDSRNKPWSDTHAQFSLNSAEHRIA
jgi:EAL domain-containing protein (putative c-di-GMP-specific phosphodiesterase class I)